MKKSMVFLLLLAIGMALVGGCAGSTANTQASDTTTLATSSSADGQAGSLNADGVQDAQHVQTGEVDRTGWPDRISIALMPNEHNPEVGQRNEGFCKALEEHLGMRVDLFVGSDYGVGIEAMRAGNLDVMLVSPMSYYQAKSRVDIEPLVTTLAIGAVPYKTVFFTQKDRSDINTLADLQDKTFAFVDPGSSSGYLFPKSKLVVDLDLDPDQLELPGYFFEAVKYAGSHDASVMGAYMGDYDAATAAATSMLRMSDAGLIDMDELKIIGETDEIPNPCYIIKTAVPQSFKDAILSFFLAYDDEAYFEQLYADPDMRFIRAYESDFDVVAEMQRVLHIGG